MLPFHSTTNLRDEKKSTKVTHEPKAGAFALGKIHRATSTTKMNFGLTRHRRCATVSLLVSCARREIIGLSTSFFFSTGILMLLWLFQSSPGGFSFSEMRARVLYLRSRRRRCALPISFNFVDIAMGVIPENCVIKYEPIKAYNKILLYDNGPTREYLYIIATKSSGAPLSNLICSLNIWRTIFFTIYPKLKTQSSAE